MSNIYSAPQSELVHAPSTDEYGSVDRAVNGDYHFVIGEVVNEAWEKTKGAKGPILLALGLYVLVYAAVAFASHVVLSAAGLASVPESDGSNMGSVMAFNLLQNTVVTVSTLPLMLGVFILGLRRAVDAPLSVASIMNHYDKTVALAVTLGMMYLMLTIGFILLIVPGVYLSIAYYMALPLVAEKGMRPWQALETSRKSVGKRWFAVFGLCMLIGLINMLGMLALGIGLVWTIPFTVIAFGILYRNMFGFEAATVAS